MSQRRNLLTEIEIEVLADVARGLENAEIARAQYRSMETIRTHVKNILRKLKARNRTHAVAIAYHLGIFHGREANATHQITDTRSPLSPPSRTSNDSDEVAPAATPEISGSEGTQHV